MPTPIRRLLPFLGVLALLALPTSAQAATLGCADDTRGTTDLATWIPAMLDATNAHRATKGLAPLQLDATLAKASTWKARDLAVRDYFTHDDPAGPDGSPARSPWERLTACGFTAGGARAENIAAGQQSGAAFVQAWINSAGHRANIENASMKYVGFGVARLDSSTYDTYAVQMFSSEPGPVATTTPPPSDTTDDGGTGDGSTSDEVRDPREQVGTVMATGASAVTRARCRSRFAVRGWCWYLTTRGRLASATTEAAASRRVTITRRTASGRFVAVGATTSSTTGGFVVRRLVRPPARGTSTWLARNARVVGIDVTPQVGEAPARVATLVARVRI